MGITLGENQDILQMVWNRSQNNNRKSFMKTRLETDIQT